MENDLEYSWESSYDLRRWNACILRYLAAGQLNAWYRLLQNFFKQL